MTGWSSTVIISVTIVTHTDLQVCQVLYKSVSIGPDIPPLRRRPLVVSEIASCAYQFFDVYQFCSLDKIRSLFPMCTCNVYVNVAMKPYRSQSAKERTRSTRRRSRRRFWLLTPKLISPWKVPVHRRRQSPIMSSSRWNPYSKRNQVGCDLETTVKKYTLTQMAIEISSNVDVTSFENVQAPGCIRFGTLTFKCIQLRNRYMFIFRPYGCSLGTNSNVFLTWSHISTKCFYRFQSISQLVSLRK